MDEEQPAAGDAGNRGHRNEAVEVEATLVAGRRDDDEGLHEFNDFVTEAAAAGTTAVSGTRSEDQRPRHGSGNSGPRSGRVRTGAGATTASAAAAARVRHHEGSGAGQAPSSWEGFSDDEDGKARDMREFDHYVKMQLQLQPTQQPLTRPQQSRRRPSTEGSQAARLSTRLQQRRRAFPSSTEGGSGGEVVAPAEASHLDLELRL